MSTKKWPRWVWILAIISLIIYLNIGWTIGSYVYENTYFSDPSEIQTITAKFMAGPGNWTVDLDTPESLRLSRTSNNLISSLMWPLYLTIITVSWMFWFIFFGGLAKLAGFA